MGHIFGIVAFSALWFACTAFLCGWELREGRRLYRNDANALVKARVAVAITGVVATGAYAAVLASWPTT